MRFPRITVCRAVTMLTAAAAQAQAQEQHIVRNHLPKADIVVAEDAPRSTRLAAQELQLYVKKISQAFLPLRTAPSADMPVHIFIGKSLHTDRLGINTDTLRFGAYRIVSGEGWLVLIGDDTDFVPIDPWPRNNDQWVSGKTYDAWDRITDTTWGNPIAHLRKHYTGRAWAFGTESEEQVDKDGTVNVWGFDERGSFNAVCGFLRDLGVRWYMPGDLGEVVPDMASISLPAVDKTVHPAFPIRRVNIRLGVHGKDTARWAMRLGIRDPYGVQIAHGMHTMTHRDAVLSAHPAWFASYGGKRQNQPGQRHNQLCYSNDALFRETVQYVRTVFDHYDFDVVSVMPPDGYVAICQCPLCRGKDTPERGSRGRLSDYVWDFVNRVAQEVGKTHADRMVSNCAYGVYTLPPLSIDRLEPNVLVCIVGGRRPFRSRAEQRQDIRRLRDAWLAKTDNPIMVFENYPFTDRGWYLPAYVPTSLGQSINATKRISMGEDIWLSVRRDFDKVDIGFNHFLVYFTTRMYWGDSNQDVDALFDEYCRLFYGPAGDDMNRFFRYCEANWQEMAREKPIVDQALELFSTAGRRVAPDSVYGRRITRVDTYLDTLRSKREQLARKRGPVPQVRLVWEAEDIVIDGTLDDAYWQACPVASTGSLREIQTGRDPIFGTSFKTGWSKDNHLYIAVRCREKAGEPLNIATTRDDDQAVWYGDAIEILLETDAHAYYQIVVNPAGARVDLDRGAAKRSWFDWDSQAEVAARIDDGVWTVECRIPVVRDSTDPLHQVVGRKPTASLPWFINVCRQRIRDDGEEYSAFSPTGKPVFHDPLTFGRLYDGRSQQFEATGSLPEYLAAASAAAEHDRQGRRNEALQRYVDLAKRDELTDFQTSAALEKAVECALRMREFEQAMSLANKIPVQSVADTARMRVLLAMRQSERLIERFADTEPSEWPFWARGEALYLRGKGFSNLENGSAAEGDLSEALAWTTDERKRADIWLALGQNREQNLAEDAGALNAYREITAMTRHTGSATYYRGVQGAARILHKQGKLDEAVDTLHIVDLASLHGYWRGAIFRQLGDTLRKAGRHDKALTAYAEVLENPKSSAGDRRAAEEAIRKRQ